MSLVCSEDDFDQLLQEEERSEQEDEDGAGASADVTAMGED